MRYDRETYFSRNRKALIISGIAILALVIPTGFLLWSGKIADDVYENTKNESTAANPDDAQWVQTAETYYDGSPMQWYYYTCRENGRKEGTIHLENDGLWSASSENESQHYDRVRDAFHTKEQAQQAIEKFVKKFQMCSEEHK